jgi:hypothetical protein
MVWGQRPDALDRSHNQLRHGRVHVIPARVVIPAECFRQVRVRNRRPVEFPFEDDKNNVLLGIRAIRHAHEPSPEPA